MKISAPILVTALFLSGCQSAPGPSDTNSAASQTTVTSSPDQEASLYKALGKRDGISHFTTDLLYIILDDKRIRHRFKGLDINEFHRHLTDFICRTSGGPCDYTGKGIDDAHEGMNISETEFNALVNDLILAMEKNGIPIGAKNRLLSRLAPLHDAIVGH